MDSIIKISKFVEKFMAIIVLFAAIVALFLPEACLWIKINWINYFLMFIMFGMGLVLKFDDFKLVFTTPKDVIVGTLAQFIIMPLLAYFLGKFFALSPELLVGVILVGASPGGTASNVITYLAKGDLALSVSITAVNTILAPLLTPFIVYFLLHTVVKINILSLFTAIINVVILPIVLGILVNMFFNKFLEKIKQILPSFSIIAIAAIIVSVVSHNADKILSAGLLIFIIVILHNLLGYIFGFGIAKIVKMDNKKSKVISIEVGMQNSGLATSLAATAFPNMALATLPGAIFSVWHNISGAVLAWFFSKKIR